MALELGKLNHLVKDVRRGGKGPHGRDDPQSAKIINVISLNSMKDKKRKVRETIESWMNIPITFPAISAEDISEEPLIGKAKVEEYVVTRVHRGRDTYRANRPRDERAPYPPLRGEYNRRVASVLALDSLTKRPKEIFATETQLRLLIPRPMLNPLRSGNTDRYCDYHQEKGHYTNDCIQLRKQLEMALELGKLNLLKKTRKPVSQLPFMATLRSQHERGISSYAP
nr:reverse transcriptase domain-containing protein [Tanacetum cinerariifolium]